MMDTRFCLKVHEMRYFVQIEPCLLVPLLKTKVELAPSNESSDLAANPRSHPYFTRQVARSNSNATHE